MRKPIFGQARLFDLDMGPSNSNISLHCQQLPHSNYYEAVRYVKLVASKSNCRGNFYAFGLLFLSTLQML